MRKRAGWTAVAVGLLIAFSAVVWSAQEVRPPAWVGIYTTAGKVGLKWSAAQGVVKYRIYRSISSGHGRELLAATTDNSYIDPTVKAGETYYYVLKSVYADGRESAYSEERYIKVPVTGGGLPVNPPDWVGILVEDKSLKLAWVPSPSSNAVAYNVYKSKEKDKGFQLIGSTQDANLTDTDVVEGETYYYVLSTLDREFKETKFGEAKSVTYTLQQEKRPEKPKGKDAKEEAVIEKMVAKPTRVIGYIIKGKDKQPLTSPSDVVVAADGTIYVADTGVNLVQLFKQGGEFVKALGVPDVDEVKFDKIIGIDVDEKGNVWAVDAYTGLIQEVDKEAKVRLRADMKEDGKAIAADLGLKKPIIVFGIVKPVLTEDRLFLVDNYNDCVEIYNRKGRYVKTFGGRGTADGKFQGPTFAAAGNDGQIYVSDCMNARVQVFDNEGNFLYKFGSYGNVVGSFGRPKGIAVDETGRVYIADSMSNVIQVFDKNGKFMFLLADERGKQMDLGTPNGIDVDKKRRIYMVEKLVNRIQIRQVGE